MTDISPESMNRGPANLITGDRFSGIVIADPVDTEMRFDIDGVDVLLTVRVTSPRADRRIVGLLFQVARPVRFRVDMLIPADCSNATVSLNDKELLPYFSNDVPADPEYVITTPCSGENKYSTLRPGEYQSINFKWESGDILKYFFYYG